MLTVRKIDGRKEEFDKKKIELSVLNAGASKQVAQEVAEAIPEEVAMTTDYIRQRVVTELRERDLAACLRYESTRQLKVEKGSATTKGVAKLPYRIMNELNIEPGDPIEVRHVDAVQDLRADEGDVEVKSIRLHEHDIRSIEAAEGTSITILSPN